MPSEAATATGPIASVIPQRETMLRAICVSCWMSRMLIRARQEEQSVHVRSRLELVVRLIGTAGIMLAEDGHHHPLVHPLPRKRTDVLAAPITDKAHVA